MAHLVETMAYTNEKPWHGLGTYIAEAPNVDTMITQAGLDWTVEKRPIYLENSNLVPSFYALTRNTDDKVLDIVGDRYLPTQNREAFEFFTEFVEAGNATMETAGSLKGGQYVWGLANLNASFKLAGGDEVKGYLLVVCPHEQGKSMIFKFTSVRVVCNNTLTLALGREGNEFRFNHRRQFDAQAITQAKVASGIAHDQLSTFEANATTLRNLEMKEAEVISLFGSIYQKNESPVTLINKFDEVANPTMVNLMGAYKNAPGAEPGTGWGALNAVTYYADHIASRTADKRLTNAWLGKTARQKVTVLDTLLKKAA